MIDARAVSDADPMVAQQAGESRGPDWSGDRVPEPFRGLRPTARLGWPHRRNAARANPARPIADRRTARAYEAEILEHQPHRPSWRCGGCGAAWPCAIARDRLAATTRPVQLAMTMASHLYDAAGELPATDPAELFDRFLAWTRSRPGS